MGSDGRERSGWLAIGLAALGAAAAVAAAPLRAEPLAEGIAQRERGQLTRSIATLQAARDAARSDVERARANAALGASLSQARRFAPALEALEQARAGLAGLERASVLLDLGNLATLRSQPTDARRHYDEALRLSGGDPSIRIAAGLNLARLAEPGARLPMLAALAQDLQSMTASRPKARGQLGLGQQAMQLGEAGTALAHGALDASRGWATDRGDFRLQAEALDALAQLYERRQRHAEALGLTRQGLAAAARLPDGAAGELPILLEWRQARLAQALGRPGEALAAYQRAVRHIEALRQDIPIDDDTGASTFRSTLEPIYLGLVEALLTASDSAPAAQRESHWRQVIETVELIRQTELQDYLGDRCDVDAVKGGSSTLIPSGTAVLYPIVLADRLELLVETGAGISRHRSSVPASTVRAAATTFAAQLRSGRPGYLGEAGRLYDWVFRPLEAVFAQQAIDTLVVVPDGALRLVAMGAFHDGSRYAIEKFAITTATGLSMTNTGAPTRGRGRGVLVAGLSTPGPVVDRLSRETVTRLLGPQAAAAVDAQTVVAARIAAPTGVAAASPSAPASAPAALDAVAADHEARGRALRSALALPGVDDEVAAIGRITPVTRLVNEDFTAAAFRRATESGDYRIVHVASHGVFGGSAEASYLLSYDELLTLDGLQSLLRSDRFRRNPIELLSLSACETAEGNDRSPLGMSGAAIRARAQAVMGSLWPVSDEAAVKLMASFYDGMLREGRSKAQALRQSQVALLRTRNFGHPFYWAPFILIGNWL